MRRAFVLSCCFALLSGAYWWFVGQILPIAVPMMLNDGAMLTRVGIETLGALVIYVLVAMIFFRWLLPGSKV